MNAIRLSGTLTRAELQREVNLTVPTVARLVEGLVREGFLKEIVPTPDRTVGRPATMVDIETEHRIAIGVDLGRDIVRIVFVNLLGEIVRERTLPSSNVRHNDELLNAILNTLDESQWDRSNLIGIGVAAPGSLNPHPEKRLFIVQDIPDHHWHHESLIEKIEQTIAVPAWIENDANAAALGEIWFGAGRGVNHLVFVLHDVGLGAGLAINGNIYAGEHNVAGELAHMIVDVDGEVVCGCGRPGCLGGVAPAHYIVETVRETKDEPNMTVSSIVKAARRGVEPEKSVVEKMLNYLAASIVNIIQVIDPSKIVVGGSIMLENPYLFDELKHKVRKWTEPEDIDMVPTVSGQQAVALGAATLVLKDIFDHAQLV